MKTPKIPALKMPVAPKQSGKAPKPMSVYTPLPQDASIKPKVGDARSKPFMKRVRKRDNNFFTGGF